MGARRIRREQRARDQRMSRIVNGHKKQKERVRRERRIIDLLKKHELPYTPSIMSWVSEQVGKPTTRISKEDIDQLVAQN